MKYISFAIPCYNSAAYMDRAVESILKGGEDVEIIIVNDGSKDDTSKIAHAYAEKYPTIIRAVDKENGGHGDAVNVGLDHAEGKYFKVVDSDDWVDEEALHKILDVLKKFEDEEKQVDMLLANYVYEKEGMEHKKVIEYKTFPSGTVYSDAFCYLPDRFPEIVSAQAAKAYVLCGQYLCLLSTSACA